MSLTPEQIVQERVNFAGFIDGRTTSTIIPYVAIWLACAESKQAEIDALHQADVDAQKWISDLTEKVHDLLAENGNLTVRIELEAGRAEDEDLMRAQTTRIAELEKDAARYRWSKPILTGESTSDADKRALALGAALMIGLDGDEAIDKAMGKEV